MSKANRLKTNRQLAQWDAGDVKVHISMGASEARYEVAKPVRYWINGKLVSKTGQIQKRGAARMARELNRGRSYVEALKRGFGLSDKQAERVTANFVEQMESL